ncbi:MAG: small basic protein [Planctomycetota bacterium]
MSIDNSLKVKGGLSGKRNVLKRAERIAKMKANKSFEADKDKPLGLPKTRVDR